MLRTRSVVLLITLTLSVAACADEESGAGDGTGPTAPTGATGVTGATGASGPTSSETPLGDPGAEIEDGRHFGYVVSVDPAGGRMDFDLAYFLTGDEANEAAEEHGDETPVPNDYYIVNDNPKLRSLVLAPDLEIVLLDWEQCCDETFLGDLEAFASAFVDGPVTVDGHVYQGSTSPYWVTVAGGVVTRIEEQYLP